MISDQASLCLHDTKQLTGNRSQSTLPQAKEQTSFQNHKNIMNKRTLLWVSSREHNTIRLRRLWLVWCHRMCYRIPTGFLKTLHGVYPVVTIVRINGRVISPSHRNEKKESKKLVHTHIYTSSIFWKRKTDSYNVQKHSHLEKRCICERKDGQLLMIITQIQSIQLKTKKGWKV